jgi:hypothetical protein
VKTAPLRLLVGVLVHSGRRFLSLLSFSLILASLATTIYFLISYGCLMRLFSCCGFLSFLLRSGLSVFLSPRLLPLLVWHEAVPRCPSYTRRKPPYTRRKPPPIARGLRSTCFLCALPASFSNPFLLSCSLSSNWLVS